MQCRLVVNLGAPLLGGGFVTGRRGKPCSYRHLIAPDGGVSMGVSGHFRGGFGEAETMR